MSYYQHLQKLQSKYLTLVATNESKENIKKYKDMLIKIKSLIRSITKDWKEYDENYIKIKFNLDDKLPLKKWEKVIAWI